MTLSDPDIKMMIIGWQEELRHLTGNYTLVLQAYQPPPGNLKMKEIIEAVAEETGIDIDKIRLKTRIRSIVLARHLVIYYGRMCAGVSFAQLGEIVGGRDHTTAIHANNTILNLLDSGNPDVCGMVAGINNRLQLNNASEIIH